MLYGCRNFHSDSDKTMLHTWGDALLENQILHHGKAWPCPNMETESRARRAQLALCA
jgi:hypothetical protein